MADPFFKDLAFAALAQTARNPTGDFLQATPRNPILGYLSDLAASSYSPERTQQMQGVAKFMSAPAISETLDRLSYGEPLTTGAGGLGGTTRVRPEALEAAMTVAPTVVPALNMIRPAVKAGARALGPTAVSMGEGYLQRRGLMPELDVYHGSPYKFDRFDASKIGTGEGAQAYGYGIYTAENPGVAKSYQQTEGMYKRVTGGMTNKEEFIADHLSQGRPEMSILDLYAQKYGGSFDDAMKDLVSVKQMYGGGSLYKVDLPDEQIAKMLDWDKPMSEQSDAVKAAIGLDKNPNASIKDLTGLEFYVAVGGKLGNPSSSSKEAANYFVKKGIPGIKYLDQGSRGASGTGKWKLKFPSGEEKIYDFKPDDDVLKMMNATAEPYGTRNFVTFPGEEQSMTILERNNQPVQQAMNEFEQSLINFMATPTK